MQPDCQLIKLDKAHQLLAEANSIKEVLPILKQAELAELYAKKVKLGEEAEMYARAIKLAAQRKAGEFLAENIKYGNPKKLPDVTIKLDDIGITKRQSSDWQKLAELPQETFEEVKEGKKTLKQAKTELRQKEIRKTTSLPEMPDGLFNVIYADPPWRYEFSETKSREIENQYPTMSLEEIKALEIPCASDSVLLLWVTAPKLEEGLEVMNAWGFKYRTCAVWDKQKIGMGYWFRNRHELLLLGVKGDFSTPLPENRFSSVFSEKREKHSQKPKEFYRMIETMFPNRKYLELFARQKFNAKWSIYGNQTT